MSIEETNGLSAPNEDTNVARIDSFESVPVGQAAESNEAALNADDAAQASSEGSTDDMSAFEEQVESSDLATVPERIANVKDQLAHANAELCNQDQEYADYVHRSKEAIPGYKTADQDEIIGSLISVLDNIAAVRAHGDLEDGPFTSIATKLKETLKTRSELECYDTPGDDFDPALHDVLMATTSPDAGHPVIRQVLTSGYRHDECVVRAVKVLASNPE